MRTKDFIYYASAAVLLAVTTQVAQADEVATQTPSVTEENQYQPATAAEIFGGEAALPVTPSSTVSAPAASSEVTKASAPAVSTSPASQSSEAATATASTSVANSTVAVASTSVTSSVVSSESGTASTSATSSEMSNSTVATPAKLTNSTDVPSPTLKVQPKTFIDVSSHNGEISVDDYRALARQGVGGVVVKLTEDTWYNNPKAASQVRNAQIAGLQVSTYHFSRYTTEEEARAEARFYIQAAQNLNLPKSTVMVNDFEDSKMLPNINRNTQAWVNEMRKHGYNNLMFYTSASWLDENNLGYRGPVSTSQFGIENFWVAQYPSSTLTATSAKNMRYNAKTGAWQYTATANLLPGKHVFDHSVDYTGRFTANASAEVDATQGNLSGTISIVNNNPTLGSFDVVISNVKAPNGVETVSVPIWSEINGQDDIIWYTANRQNNGTYTVNVKASAHKNSTGLYNVHLYYVQKDGQLMGVGGTTTQVFIGKTPEQLKPKASFAIENNNAKAGTFDAVITNISAPLGVKEVLVPSWSLENGQDDLIWHKATRQADGSYRVTIKATDHKNSTGKYRADVYLVDDSNKRFYLTEKVVEVTQTRPSASLFIENNNADLGTFDAVIRNIVAPNGVKEVLVPSWSLVNGQDDLVWHKASRQTDGSYRVTIKASEHKNSLGNYRADVYIVDNANQRHYVTETIVDVKHNKPVGTISVVNNNNDTGTFDVIISDVYSSKGVRTVQVPIWSEKDGQDDIRWYEATRQANGTYTVNVQATNHKNSTGLYNIHLYYILNDGSQVGVGGTTTTVEFRNAKTKTQTYITNVNSEAGSFTVVVDQAPQGRHIKNIRVAVWSESNQGNLSWYNTAPTGTHTEINVSTVNHKNLIGNYTTHVYVDYVDNTVDGFNLGEIALAPRNRRVEPQTTYYSQRDPRWASKWYGVSNMDQSGCVPTSLAMTFTDILGTVIAPTTVADYLYYNTNSFNKTSVAGTDADGIVLASKNWGLKSNVLSSIANIASALMSGQHVLAAVGASQFINYPYTHEIVLHGYDNGKTYVRDPFNANNNGWYSLDYIHGVQSRDAMDTKLGAPFFSVFA
ncbi:MAG: GBS Bsp-like repeat-containing protein [Streptococcus salivarius]|nr:GBS Bsp-like repeat-containing protein [Streptococcus salivarius]